MVSRAKISKKRTKRQVQDRLHQAQTEHTPSTSSHPQYPVYNPSTHRHRSSSPPSSPDRSNELNELSIQGYEAEILNNPALARDVDARQVVDPQGRSTGKLLKVLIDEAAASDEGIWADRFSYLHILPAFHSSSSQPRPPSSPSASSSTAGWSDLPSDAEDTFFFSGSEGENYEHDKKRRKLDALRGGRLAALEDERKKDGLLEGQIEDVWGLSDEEPPESIAILMEHTSKSLQASPNPNVLELRILTNHGSDPRFAFFRGRWRKRWEAFKAAAKKPPPPVVSVDGVSKGGLGLLGGYGSDEDDDSDASSSGSERKGPGKMRENDEIRSLDESSKEDKVRIGEEDKDSAAEEEAKRRRRERAKAWAASRKVTS
ncbi:hypothetical protein [Phaffia rhodozyma]|uniref:Uncharacterized protein n=1 Tax=Phaffia rhodozyma TaxID=264483 RepID=A0A0F7SSL4_PHARH|nr:hypothetical protein [Phaffia rhodozyma]